MSEMRFVLWPKRRVLPTALTVLLALSITGCASTYRVYMPQNARKQVQSANIVVVVPQQEIYADFLKANTSGASGQGGLIGALISTAIDAAYNTSQSNKAEELVVPVKDSIMDYEFRRKLKSQVDSQLAVLPWLHSHRARIESDIDEEEIAALIAGSNESVLLLMKVDYHLTPGLKELKLTSTVTIYPIDDELKVTASKRNPDEKVPLLYRNRFVFLSPCPDTYLSANEAALVWSADKGRITRAAMDEGVYEVSRMLVLDLDAAKAAADAESKGPVEKPAREKVEYGGHTGTLVAETSERAIIRIADGELYSVVK